LDEFYDAAVSGADHVDQRRGFAAMLKRIEGSDIDTIIVETANRFARDLMVQEVGYSILKERGIELIAADSPTSFLDDTPTAKLIRQVLGAVAEFDKAMTVAKLPGPRVIANAPPRAAARAAEALWRRTRIWCGRPSACAAGPQRDISALYGGSRRRSPRWASRMQTGSPSRRRA
jgi:hypothetical protein